MARLVSHLEGDAAPLSSYDRVFACLRAAQANKCTVLTVADRQNLQGVLVRLFASFTEPLVDFNIFLDPFWGPVRGRYSVLLRSGLSVAKIHEAAVLRLCGSGTDARIALMAELASLAAMKASHVARPTDQTFTQPCRGVGRVGRFVF